MTKQFKKSDLKKAIIEKYGSIELMKKYLQKNAVNEYGCLYFKDTVYGCKVSYTSNPNCFASYLISIPCVGFSGQYGIGKGSITQAGHNRGCGSYYIEL